jgi:Ca-activated chloride channel homolog
MKKISVWFLLVIVVLAGCKKNADDRMPYEKAVKELNEKTKEIKSSENMDYQITDLNFQSNVSVADTLPPIDQFDIVVNGSQNPGDVAVEIFTSTEKSGSGTDGWMVEIAKNFNAGNISLKNGKIAKVNIRKIASGTGYEFIAYRKYLPDAFSPSSDLWIKMIEANGVKVTKVSDRLVRNVAGIVMKDDVYKNLKVKYNDVNIKTITDSVIQKNLFMGYTNPFASSTGLNFLYTLLATFSNNDETKMLTPETISAFQEFQKGVPFVALTTLQMRDSVEKGGSLQAFVLEWQTFNNTKNLRSGYKFIPFGYYHDNPLYAIEDIGAEKMEVLNLFAKFANSKESKEISSRYGFGNTLDYKENLPPLNGKILIEAQKLWKTEKDSGKPIVAVFVSDTSGSMSGEKLNNLKKALIAGSKFIDPKNYIGLISFDSKVTKLLDIDKFNEIQKAKFVASVENMDAVGQTAMFDAILFASKMLIDAKEKIPNSKLMIFVLTDGETNSGAFKNISNINDVLGGLGIPVYTIGYGTEVTVLQELSNINEAASLKAKEEDVSYQIGNLLNAQM